MELEEIKVRLDRIRDTLDRGGKFDIDWAVEVLAAAREYLDDVEDDPPVKVDDGFVILPVTRYEALREAEENLQETRFEPADGEADEKQATIDALTRRLDGVCNESNGRLKEIERLVALVRNLHRSCDEYHSRTHAMQEEIGRLKGDAEVRADAAAPLRDVSGRRASEEVFLKHIQDIQAEIDGIKDRLDEITQHVGAANLRWAGIKRQVDDMTPSFDAKLGAHWDRINAFAARLNRLEADVMPIRGTGCCERSSG
jgi:chromosome segregation ATPase